MEAETTAENVSSETPTVANSDAAASVVDFGTLLSLCGSCKESLHGRNPKLLSCLHTFCLKCVNSLETGDSGQITCPVCRQVSLASNMIDNMFLTEVVAGQASTQGSSDASAASSAHTCTGCEENVAASHYCIECTEFLCEPCAQAHRRVKVTKDHTVDPVDRAPVNGGNPGASPNVVPKRRPLLCPVHPHELLKLYCDTCSRLTCRDCQLVEHKDHKYQFVQEAAVACRDLLQSLLTKITEKQSHIDNAKALIDRRHKEITTKEMAVAQEIKMCANALVREINNKGHLLIGELQAVCNAKRRQLEQKNTEVRLLSDNLEHGLRFADYLLTSTDDAALLYSRRTLAHQLSAILRTRCEVPNPYHVVDLRFNPNPSVSAAIANLGCLMVDGYQYGSGGSRGPAVAGSGTAAAAVTGANGRVSSSSAHGYGAMRPSASAGSSAATTSSLTSSMTSEQKLAKLQMLINIRRMEHQQRTQQQRSATTVGSGGGLVDYPSGPPDYGSMGRRADNSLRSAAVPPPLSSSRHLTQMPNQSANISSSNHRSSSAGLYPPPLVKQIMSPSSSYVPSVPGTGMDLHNGGEYTRMSLDQLQEERLKRLQKAELVSTSMPPIVIQPSNLSDSLSRSVLVNSPGLNNFSGGSYKTQYSNDSNAGLDSTACDIMSMTGPRMKAESLSRLSDIKQEFKSLEAAAAASSDMVATTSAMSRSRTPTPRIESTTSHDAPSSIDSPHTSTPMGLHDLANIDVHLADMSDDNNFDRLCETSGDLAEALMGTADASTVENLFGDAATEAALGNLSDVIGHVSARNNEQSNEAAATRKVKSPPTDPKRDAHVPTPPPPKQSSKKKSDTKHHHSSDKKSGSALPADSLNDDQNEDYCAVCRNGGELLCCERCPRVYHLPCHVPVISVFPSDDVQWLCTLCATSDDELKLDVSPEPRPVIGSKRRSGPAGLTDREHQICERLLLEVYTHELSLPFHLPVPKSIPNYYRIILRPMDMSKIRTKLNRNNSNSYQSVEEFINDVNLIFENCALFNPPETDIAKAGVEIHNLFKSRVAVLLPYLERSGNASTPTTPSSDQSSCPPLVRVTGSAAGPAPAKRRRTTNPKSSGGMKNGRSSSHGSLDGDGVNPDLALSDRDDSRHSTGANSTATTDNLA